MHSTFKGHLLRHHPSWGEFLTPEVNKEIYEIENLIGDEALFTPPSNLVFRFLTFDLNKLKICILGQDPYPQAGAATGRAFEDNRVTNWDKTGENASLRNILKLLHKNDQNTDNIFEINKVRKDIHSGIFKIIGPDKLFDSWEKQGVLLLNTALTCQIGSTEVSNSHSMLWACLTGKILKFIDSQTPNCIWLLWGKHAQKYSCLLNNPDKHFFSNHPSLNSKDKGSFFFENTFEKVRDINWINNLK